MASEASRNPTSIVAPARVGLIGPTFVGKTTYFSVLDRALRDLEWRVVSQGNDKESAELLNRIRNFTNQGLFPRKTQAKVPDRGLYYRISDESNRVFELTFYDPPGEIFEPNERESQYRDTRETLFRSMEDVGGLLVLLSLEKTPHELANIWHYSIESFIAHLRRAGRMEMIAHDKLRIRVAVVFTKADLLPWMSRYRTRDAEHWLNGQEGLRSLAADIRRDCSEVQFRFSSAVGWNKGRPNVRTVVKPRLASESTGARGTMFRELIPDPAEGGDRSASERSRRMLPVFSDPVRVVDEPLHDLIKDLQGVVTLPGRTAPQRETGRFLTPWNVVEPLLWAAGLSDS